MEENKNGLGNTNGAKLSKVRYTLRRRSLNDTERMNLRLSSKCQFCPSVQWKTPKSLEGYYKSDEKKVYLVINQTCKMLFYVHNLQMQTRHLTQFLNLLEQIKYSWHPPHSSSPISTNPNTITRPAASVTLHPHLQCTQRLKNTSNYWSRDVSHFPLTRLYSLKRCQVQ